MKLVSFIIPCYRSAGTITSVVEEINRSMELLPEYRHEIVLVNDCSPDDTFAVIEALASGDNRITAVDLAKNFGQHAAIMAGLSHCSGDYIVCLDDDGQTPADEVGKLLSKLEEGYDVVYASYGHHKQHSFFRLPQLRQLAQRQNDGDHAGQAPGALPHQLFCRPAFHH